MKQSLLALLAIIALALFLALGLAQTVFAQWSNDPNVNTPVATQLNNQFSPQLCSDGTGGAIIAWYENSNASSGDVSAHRAQRLNAAGVPQWGTNGVAIKTFSYPTYWPELSFQIVSDGAGGAIIAWYQKLRGSDTGIYVQRLNAAGVPQWGTDGVVVGPFFQAWRGQYTYQLISDGSGGAIITWRSGYSPLAQRVNSSGIVQWAANGVVVCTAAPSNEKRFPQLVSDGSGGAIITWEDRRAYRSDIYAQRLNAAGVPQWAIDGVLIFAEAPSGGGNATLPQITNDGTGGAIIAWPERGSGSSIYAQRVNSSGVVQWATNGVAICLDADFYAYPSLISDGTGGAIITWQDDRNVPSSYDTYAQRVSFSGVVQWATNGFAICTATNYQLPQLTSDSFGGAIITWEDNRGGISHDIYAQRVNSSGVAQWPTNGVTICKASQNQLSPQLISDGLGGAIITWSDSRNGNSDIYAQNINRNGQLGTTGPSVIANGQFEQGTTNWTMYSAAPNGINFSTVPGGPSGSYAKVHINATSNNMQVYQTYFPLTAGKRYTLGFDAYSPTSRKVFVTVHKHGAPYGSYGFGEWIQLGPNWTHYERQFTAAGFSGTTSDTRLRFYFVYACGPGDDYYFDNVSLAQVLAKSGEEQIAEQPTTFRLEQNYPNPFNPTTEIRYQTSEVGNVKLSVFDVLGREVTTLVNAVEEPGYKSVKFDATSLSSGMYFYRLQSGPNIQTRKMIVVR